MAIKQEQIDRAATIAEQFGATRLILFGSALERPARGNDLDFACDGVKGWDIYRLGAKLEKELHLSIDIIPLSPANKFTRHIEIVGKRII